MKEGSSLCCKDFVEEVDSHLSHWTIWSENTSTSKEENNDGDQTSKYASIFDDNESEKVEFQLHDQDFKDPISWDVTDIKLWLKSIQFSQYEECFRDITGASLILFSYEDLERIGIASHHICFIRKSIFDVFMSFDARMRLKEDKKRKVNGKSQVRKSFISSKYLFRSETIFFFLHFCIFQNFFTSD
jgi:hypothetical protein